MTKQEALQIVYELAEQSALFPDDLSVACDDTLSVEADRQTQALEIVARLIPNVED